MRSSKRTRLQVLFLVALLGVLLVLGLAVQAVVGTPAAVGYAVVAVKDGTARLLVRRETDDDLVRLDVE